MKIIKLFGLLFASILLTGCGKYPVVPPDPEPTVVEVERIITQEPVVEVELDDYALLHYVIYPTNATDKTVHTDETYLEGVAVSYIDSDNNVYVRGLVEGTGVLSIITSNGKYVSFSITVINTVPPEPPEPEIPTIDRIANYFNESSEDMSVDYIAEENRWFGKKNFGHSTDTSAENLGTAAYFIKSFLPSFLFRYTETYGDETGRTEFELLMVNSNISAAALITSYIENECLMAEITIENMW